MLLRQLEYLVALAREGHFGRAAESCWVSQPTLSSAIHKLESDLGVAIVRRAHRFEGLTPEGEQLVVWAQRMLAERDDILSNYATLRSGYLSGQLRIGAIPTSLPPIAQLTEAFCLIYPRVDIKITSQPSSDILRRLRSFEIDVGLMYLDGTGVESMDSLALYEERYLLLTPTSGSFEGRTSVSWAEAAGTPLCLLSSEMENRQILDRIFAEAGAAAEPQIETNSMSVLAAHVATGHWSSIVSESWLSLFAERAGTCLIPLEGSQPMRSIGIVTAPRHTRSSLTSAFIGAAQTIDMRKLLSVPSARLHSRGQSFGRKFGLE